MTGWRRHGAPAGTRIALATALLALPGARSHAQPLDAFSAEAARSLDADVRASRRSCPGEAITVTVQPAPLNPAALFAVASAAVRTKGSYCRDKYNRLRARRGPVRAIMAIAHKLLIAAFHMLSTGEAFRDLGDGYLDQAACKRSTTKLVQRLSNMG